MSKPLLILFGTFSGNSESCAEKAAHVARQRGYDPVLENMMDSTADVLGQFDTALLITSTYGDGDPPDGTENFYEEVVNRPRLRLDHLRYAVLALGIHAMTASASAGRITMRRWRPRGPSGSTPAWTATLTMTSPARPGSKASSPRWRRNACSPPNNLL